MSSAQSSRPSFQEIVSSYSAKYSGLSLLPSSELRTLAQKANFSCEWERIVPLLYDLEVETKRRQACTVLRQKCEFQLTSDSASKLMESSGLSSDDERGAKFQGLLHQLLIQQQFQDVYAALRAAMNLGVTAGIKAARKATGETSLKLRLLFDAIIALVLVSLIGFSLFASSSIPVTFLCFILGLVLTSQGSLGHRLNWMNYKLCEAVTQLWRFNGYQLAASEEEKSFLQNNTVGARLAIRLTVMALTGAVLSLMSVAMLALLVFRRI